MFLPSPKKEIPICHKHKGMPYLQLESRLQNGLVEDWLGLLEIFYSTGSIEELPILYKMKLTG